MTARIWATAILVSLLGQACAAAEDAGPRSPGPERTQDLGATSPGEAYVVVAAGDLVCERRPLGAARPDRCQYDETADQVDGPGLLEVLTLGDNQYEEGEYRAFTRYYDASWGRVQDNTSPVPGNHDHAFDPNAKPRGYFRYFGDRVEGPKGWGYYSFDLPEGCEPGMGVCWHFIALNSQLCFASGGCDRPADPSDVGIGEQMWRWLRRDLRLHPNSDHPCTVAYWHHPLFSISTESGPSAAVRPLWRLLYRAGADLVLNAHSHNYQRWAPQTPSGDRDDDGGIRQFIVGTGGYGKYALQSGDRPANLARAQDTSFGVLRLVLEASSYRWRWRTAEGQLAFRDASTSVAACV